MGRMQFTNQIFIKTLSRKLLKRGQIFCDQDWLVPEFVLSKLEQYRAILAVSNPSRYWRKINTGNCGNLGQYMQDLAIWVQDKFKINLGSRDKYWKGSKDKYWKLWKSRSIYAGFCNSGSREREALQIITPTACRAAKLMPHCPCIPLKHCQRHNGPRVLTL